MQQDPVPIFWRSKEKALPNVDALDAISYQEQEMDSRFICCAT
jgi:hypothetical protein